MVRVVVTEKPSVARDIGRVLGANARHDGYLSGGDFVITWALGHLVRLAQPHEIRPEWKAWRQAALPLLPDAWPLPVVEKTRSQFEVVRRLINQRQTKEVICATDAGREGELIFRYIYERAGCTKPVQRLWISSLTAGAIRTGFQALRPGRAFDDLAASARARSRADWLVGMNLSRAYSLRFGDTLSVGRVQTPTLALLVDRELAIRNFVAEDYTEVEATFEVAGSGARTPAGNGATGAADPTEPHTYMGVYQRDEHPADTAARLPPDGEEAALIVERARTGRAEIAGVQRQIRRLKPPLLYDLAELQRDANRSYGLHAKRTLELAQELYEKHKLITYPRTDSRHLTRDVADTLSDVVAAITPRYPGIVAAGSGTRRLGSRFVDDTRVSDHHAIVPTATAPRSLPVDAGEIYDLICRRLLAAWHPDHQWAVTTVLTDVTGASPAASRAASPVDRYRSRGSAVVELGWRVTDVRPRRVPDALPSGLQKGDQPRVANAEIVHKQTRPPPELNDASLLTAMETAGKTLDDRDLSDAMRDRGLGTPATRAAIIETLLLRGYVERRGKALRATDKGLRLISVVHERVKSPAMTGEWEQRLLEMAQGRGELREFMQRIEEYVRQVVEEVGTAASPPPTDCPPSAPPAPPHVSSAGAPAMHRSVARSTPSTGAPSQPACVAAPAPTSQRSADQPTPNMAVPSQPAPSSAMHRPVRTAVAPRGLLDLLTKNFGFRQFRPHQERICAAVTAGRSALVVMPTGAGKSLCFQLPGLARAGTTLVVSPLIALMEDQVAKLAARGCAAERIHSARSRADSARVYRQYEAGALDFLFVAPERLKVAAFVDMLARHPPRLVAIDEAHCISEWGHDFRPDYRMLGARLPALAPAPVVALTATATPRVQDDIIEQLGLSDAQRFIHGFRRDNLAVEAIELGKADRPAALNRILTQADRLPAIVYTPTRAEAELLPRQLPARVRAATYHAGMSATDRNRVHARFSSGELDVVVATIAFGMGIDKANIRTVVHTALPGSVEGYYQEIGRAGRDGEPARAVLMHGFADQRTHEFFLDRDYPDPNLLQRIFHCLRPRAQTRDELRRAVGLDEEVFDRALSKLWTSGGAHCEPDESVARGRPDWVQLYAVQRQHKRDQLDHMLQFARSRGCRMVRLVRYFGDREDRGTPCGRCDGCAPAEVLGAPQRKATAAELQLVAGVVGALRTAPSYAVGALFRRFFEGQVARNEYEAALTSLRGAELISIYDDTFDKDGKRIEYRRVRLTPAGRQSSFTPEALGELVTFAATAGSRKKTRASSRGAGSARKSSRTAQARKSGQAARPSKSGTSKSGQAARTSKSGTSKSGQVARARKSGTRKSGQAPRTRKPGASKSGQAARTSTSDTATSGAPALFDALKAWRLREARCRSIPAYRIASDRVLSSVAAVKPRRAAELRDIRGVGPQFMKNHGRAVLKIIQKAAFTRTVA